MTVSNARHLYMHLGKVGPFQLLTPGSPQISSLRVPSNSPLRITQPRVDSLRCAARSSHPALGWCGTERKYTKTSQS